jgi:putative glutamine amidotransferase
MKLIIIAKILIFFLTIQVLGKDSLRVVFSKAVGSENYSKYCQYLRNIYPEIDCINAFGLKLEEIDSVFKDADGLVLTGGVDVNPRYYGRSEDSSLCEVDDYRDSLEFQLIKLAFERNIPIYAICRGEQILNVYLGGTLFSDIQTYKPNAIQHSCGNGKPCSHLVFVEKESNFYELIGRDTVTVNSFHHQAVERLAKDLKGVAFAEDGVIEAYEWKNPNGKPFLIAVQWHPERLASNDPVAFTLGKKFIEEVLQRKQNHKN